MPSGAKKRKAAKKKKENQSNNDSAASPVSTYSIGNEDVEQQEDKEGDIGDVRSPTLEDHHGQKDLLTEGKEQVIQKERNVEGSRIEIGAMDIAVEEGDVQVERNGLDGKEGMIKHFEAQRESGDGGSFGSSSSQCSSLDDKSHSIKNSLAAVDIGLAVDSLNGRSAYEIPSAPIKKSVLAKQAEEETISPQDSSVAPCVIDTAMKENGEERLIHVDEKARTSVSLKNAALERDGEEIVHSVENNSTTFELMEHAAQENDYGSSAPQNAPAATAEPLLVPSPYPVQKTTWKSCCGLFDVFSGSGK